jgi:hypothetical protein
MWQEICGFFKEIWQIRPRHGTQFHYPKTTLDTFSAVLMRTRAKNLSDFSKRKAWLPLARQLRDSGYTTEGLQKVPPINVFIRYA